MATKIEKSFAALGAKFTATSGTEARGPCPICRSAKRNPFCANITSGVWQCKSCGRQGSREDYYAARTDALATNATDTQLATLAADRGLTVDTLRQWGVGVLPTGTCTIPLHADGKVVGVRLYRVGAPVEQRSRTAGRVGLLCSQKRPTSAAEVVWVAEGEWDAMALDEALRWVESPEAVVGVPGAATAGEVLALTLQDKRVHLAFDHDDAGIRGEQRVRGMLAGRAKSTQSLHWPKVRPQGYDLRDEWQAAQGKHNVYLAGLKKLLQPTPREVPGAVAATTPAPRKILQRAAGFPRDEIIALYRKWLYLPDAEVLDVIYGTVLANRLSGDPLWVFLTGPAGCGKTVLLISLSDADEIKTCSTLTPPALISGMKCLGAADPSLIPKLDGKVLVVKDFTTILGMRREAKEEIFSILRDAYDGRIEKPFGNGVTRVYNSRFGIIAGVTPAIEAEGGHASVLGERFLKYYMQHTVLTVRAGEAAMRKRIANLGKEDEMRAELAAAAADMLSRQAKSVSPVITRQVEDRLVGLAQWTARMRAAVSRNRYTHELQARPTSEIGTRLVGQLLKLATGMAMFREKPAIDAEELGTLARIARDSAPDMLESLVQRLYMHDTEGPQTTKTLAALVRLPDADVHRILTDAGMLSIVESARGPDGVEWRLTRAMEQLMRPLGLYERKHK